MILSRVYPLLKLNRANSKQVLQTVRSSHHFYYRIAAPAPPRSYVRWAEIVQGFAWWWVLWHAWTEPDHMFGEFEYPDPKKWTDEELGIPPQ